MSWSESELLRWLGRQPRARGLVGSQGHDAAVLRARPGRPVLCTDQTVEGVHFSAEASPARVGRKAVGRVLSDLAACGATPHAILVALCAPAAADARQLKALLRAVRIRAREFGADLVGGDLCCAEGPLSLAVTGSGSAPAGRPPGRDRARPGDWIVSTGPTGGSALGRHLDIEPRLAAGRALVAAGVHALMDTSDGLAIDLERMALASGVRIELEHVPVHDDARRMARRSGRTAREHALFDGEDHELLAALSGPALERLGGRGAGALHGLERLGRVRRGTPGLWMRRGAERGTEPRWGRWRRGAGEGWVHGQP